MGCVPEGGTAILLGHTKDCPVFRPNGHQLSIKSKCFLCLPATINCGSLCIASFSG